MRSTVAHGGILRHSRAESLSNLIPAFEQDVRDLLKAALQRCPHDESERLNWLKSLYEISDQDRADKLADDFNAIQDRDIRDRLMLKLSAR